jgi:small subunit ribosomal protein S6e
MKFNIAYPHTGLQKQFEFNDEKKLKVLSDKRLSNIIELDFLGDDFKGYMGKIIAGSDKDGFPMLQGVLTTERVRLLLDGGSKCFKSFKRNGERKRRSVRGCIIDPHHLSVLCLIIVKKGEKEIAGLTDSNKPRALGPKRASKIRKMFHLSKKDDVRQYVIRHEKPGRFKKDGTVRTTAPKIQRLITPSRIQRKKKLMLAKRRRFDKSKAAKEEFCRLLAKYQREKSEAKRSSRLSSLRHSTSSGGKPAKPVKVKTVVPKPADATKTAAKPEQKPKQIRKPHNSAFKQAKRAAAAAAAAAPKQ